MWSPDLELCISKYDLILLMATKLDDLGQIILGVLQHWQIIENMRKDIETEEV